MGEAERGDPSGPKKHSLDEIIDHMAENLHSYEGQYILMGSPPNQQQVWPEYTAQTNPPMTIHNPVFVQQSYDRTIQDFPQQQGLFYPNPPPPVHERSSEMIGMVNVCGGNFVVFNSANSGSPLHPYMPTHHPDPNVGFIHYQQQSQLPHLPPPSTAHRDYGLFNSANESAVNQNNHHILENVVGNWLSNKSGTYSPFGGVTPMPTEPLDDDSRPIRPAQLGHQKKTRMVAEVRPMRPSYSDVLAKSPPPVTPPLAASKPSLANSRMTKNEGKKQNAKTKTTGTNNISKVTSVPPIKRLSSNIEEITKPRQSAPFDDLTPPQSSEENSFFDYDSYIDENIGDSLESFGNQHAEEIKKEKKQKKKVKCSDEKAEALNNHKVSGSNSKGSNKRPLHINNNLQCKINSAEKNLTKSASKNARSAQDELRKGGTSKSNVSNNEEKGLSVSRVSRGTSSHKRNHRSTKRRDGQHYFNVLCKRWQQQLSHYCLLFLTWFFHLIWDVLALSARLSVHLFASTWEIGLVWLAWLQEKVAGPWWKWWGKPAPPVSPLEPPVLSGLTNNISLPATGDEAMKRLLACKGKDPYSILGVTNHCTDDDIKKYYKRQAVLVHPDKNSQPGAEEAFKILVHAFELIGEPERRSAYDRCVAETHQVEQAWSELNELLNQLHHKMEYAANTIRCTNCSKRHKRVIVQRPCYAARFCAQCKIHHSAREGDIWAESRMMGLVWHYLACMEGAVYDITEWAACQADNLKHLQANSHAVQYRIVLGKQNQPHRNMDNYNEPDLEEFLNNLYAQSGKGSTDGSSGGHESSAHQRKKGKRKK